MFIRGHFGSLGPQTLSVSSCRDIYAIKQTNEYLKDVAKNDILKTNWVVQLISLERTVCLAIVQFIVDNLNYDRIAHFSCKIHRTKIVCSHIYMYMRMLRIL